MTAPILRPQWRLQDGKPKCSWCLAETHTPAIESESHGICERHAGILIAEARADIYGPVVNQGKRWDQVEFSAAIVVLAALIVFTAGVLLGAWWAVGEGGWL